MPRRVSLPGASELFRPTQAPEPPAPADPGTDRPAPDGPQQDAPRAEAPRPPGAGRPVRGSGRVRHDEKITVYVSSDELVALEQARLTLRAEHGMAVDRGRIVREAIAALVADLQAHGAQSELVRRLSPP
ncbi:hypothetical protein ACFFOM_19700 [Microlunatus capsulatus]|uniref:Cobyrinic acid a,c-diamide synthase n=1 Tax=Microlunatus capsulatus TaxID=99117 RepID=A0ABS4ZCG8_9ACTN|nr:hypothetical protein [Microlunatus capsulatus]MBP2418763.1 hypothetical protein [Microlunatus capsulatus]